METRLQRFNLKGRQITVQLWRAVQGAPKGLSKGSMGHGLCDHDLEPAHPTLVRSRTMTRGSHLNSDANPNPNPDPDPNPTRFLTRTQPDS